MSDAAQSSCPSASELAAFVEGKLTDRALALVEAHAADCSECSSAIASAVEFLDAEREHDMGAARWWWVAAALLTALSIPAISWYAGKMTPLRRLQRLAAEAHVRAGEGRLEGFAHEPFDARRSAEPHAMDFSLRAEAARLAESPANDPRALHAKGVSSLLTGDAVAARRLLQSAVQRDPLDGSAWNDLAAAELAGDSGSAAAALAAANRALAIEQGLNAAYFNRAIALERLGRRDEAVREYRRVRRLEPSSGWAVEATARIVRLEE